MVPAPPNCFFVDPPEPLKTVCLQPVDLGAWMIDWRSTRHEFALLRAVFGIAAWNHLVSNASTTGMDVGLLCLEGADVAKCR